MKKIEKSFLISAGVNLALVIALVCVVITLHNTNKQLQLANNNISEFNEQVRACYDAGFTDGIKFAEENIATDIDKEVEDVVVLEETEEIDRKEEKEINLTSLGEFKLTAYCPCSKCNGKWAGGITSTGVTAQAEHTIAVDPKVIPYGSHVMINGHEYVAEDCGGAIKNARIDVYFDTHQEALNFGIKYAEVFMIQ